MKRKFIMSLMFILLISVGIIYKINTSSTNKIYLNEDNITNIKQQVGIYVENESGIYEKNINIPSQEDGYILDTENSICEGNTTIGWDNSSWSAVLNNIEKENLKCYLYFRYKTAVDSAKEKSLGTVDSFTGTACEGNCAITDQNGIYEAEDDYGTSYYYRGTVDNNWLVFGQDTSDEDKYIWWRIIRINGNGTLRLIYAGTNNSTIEAPATTGNDTMITPSSTISTGDYIKAVKFNEQNNDSKYVGYMYNDVPAVSTTHDQAHKVTSSSKKSTVLDEIENWYVNNTNLSSLAAKYIDVNTGFCSDTTISTNNHGGSYTGQGYGTQQTAYAGADRLWQENSSNWKSEQTPTFKCGIDDASRKRDLYTGPSANVNGTKGSNGTTIAGNNALPVPVGLITMDEVIYAGGFAGKGNSGYWLFTNRYYWTMTPYYFNGSIAGVFDHLASGGIAGEVVSYTLYGIRPVINLKSNVKITGNGTTTDPYIVK